MLRHFNSEIRYGRQFTPLVIIALYEYSMEHAKLLLSAGALPNACHPCRVPPILPALDMFNLGLVLELIRAGAEVNTYHRFVVGNMTLVVCLHFWRGLRLLLNCGAEVESLFGACHKPVERDSNDGSEVADGVLSVPIPFWRVLAEARYLMTRRGITVAQVLREMLQYTASHRLDARLAGYVDSAADWAVIKDLAGMVMVSCTFTVLLCMGSMSVVIARLLFRVFVFFLLIFVLHIIYHLVS